MSEFNYLKAYAGLLADTEVPPRFANWCGIASLLAALERRIWINQGTYAIYPNFYMVLVAASGQKKSTAINSCARILRRLNPSPNVISQKITPEALIQAIQLVVNEPGAILKKKNGGIVIADELATFLDRSALDRGLGPILTALYDCTPFEYATMKRGTEKVEDSYLSILGGTTIELLRNSLPKDAIGGGFTSRTLFVYEESVPEPVAWIEFDETHADIEQSLVNHLARLMDLEGAIDVTKDAKDYFIHDYKQRYKGGGFRNEPMLQSYENRRHAHLFKTAIALMVAERPSKVLELSHIQGAKILLEDCEQYLPRVIELIVSTDVGSAQQAVFQFIMAKGGTTRYELVRHLSNKMDSTEVSKIINTLVEARKIKIDTSGGKLSYHPTGTNGKKR